MTHPKKVWHLNDEKGWHQLTMEAIDANHAVATDPEHWAFEKPAEPVLPAVEDESGDDGDAE